MIKIYNSDDATEKKLDYLEKKEDRSRSKVIRDLIKKEYKRCKK